MIDKVKDQISVITQNANKRKIEEAKLEQEKLAIEQKKSQIGDLEKKLEVKRKKLSEKKDELEKHKKFNEFLESVVNDKGGTAGDGNKEFEDIEALQNRFKNLKSENEKLMRRVSFILAKCLQKKEINSKMEEARLELNLQISEKNSALEQDFENEINKKNKNSKEIGQIINSINNIYSICKTQQHNRGRQKVFRIEDVNEKTPNLVETLIERLEQSGEVVEDWVEVFNIIGNTYDVRIIYNEKIQRDKAYSEGLFNVVPAVGVKAVGGVVVAGGGTLTNKMSQLKDVTGGGTQTKVKQGIANLIDPNKANKSGSNKGGQPGSSANEEFKD